MAAMHKDYPSGLKDEEIEQLVKEYSEAIFNRRAQINVVLQYSPLIQLGQYELMKRQNQRVTRLTTTVSIVSLTIAVIALWMSWLNTLSSDTWEKNQVALLQEINGNLTGIRNELNIQKLTSVSQPSVTSRLQRSTSRTDTDAANPAFKRDSPRSGRAP